MHAAQWFPAMAKVVALKDCEAIEADLTSTTARLADAERLLKWVHAEGRGREVFPAFNTGTPEQEEIPEWEAITKFLSTKP